MAGLVFDMSNADYHGCKEAISNSGLNDFGQSPAHYFGRHLDPNRPPQKKRPGQLEGTLAHCALFEPDQFGRRYSVGPDVSKNTNAWKAFAAECEADKREAITQDQFDVAHHQARQARLIPSVGKGLSTGFPEVSVFWIDDETGVRCRCRPDWVHPMRTPDGREGVILFDGKTYTSAQPEDFGRQVMRKYYDRQAAFYSDGYEAATGVEVLAFIFIGMETEWPYLASAMPLKPEDVQRGRDSYRELLPRYAKCYEASTWPSYADDLANLPLPKYR
jgi:exodeoxyribonuclease VIII